MGTMACSAFSDSALQFGAQIFMLGKKDLGDDKLLMCVCKRKRMLPELSVASYVHLCSSKCVCLNLPQKFSCG